MGFKNIIFENKEITGERIELDARDGLYFLGRNLTLRNCHILIRVPAQRLHAVQVRFTACTLEAKQELKNFRWYHDIFFTGCRFIGRFMGNDFGRWPGDPWDGSIEDCDFTEARLDACRFIGCDASTLRFPRWPHFTLLDPARRSQELNAVKWPGDIGILFGDWSERPPSTAAVTFHAPSLAKRAHTTEDAIKATLARLEGVIF